MRIKINNTKDKTIKDIVKVYIDKYGKAVGAIAVVFTLCVLSGMTLVDKINKSNQSVGVIMSLSEVAEGKKAFSGELFGEKGISYVDMQSMSYEIEELAQLEKTEKQVDDILSSSIQDKDDLEDEKAEHVSASDYNNYQASDTQETVTAFAPASSVTEVTYADENGDYVYQGEFTLTGYCPCASCCGKWSNPSNPITASGTTPVAGRTVAADTSIYPFGTKLMINGQIYTVEDVGGAIKGNHIDIYFNTHDEARAFAKQYGSVYLVK